MNTFLIQTFLTFFIMSIPTRLQPAGTDSATNAPASTTQTAAPSAGNPALKEPMEVDVMCAIILVAGLLGGYLNFLRTRDTITLAPNGEPTAHKNYALLCLVGGVVAAALIPLFLKIIQSNLLEDKGNNISYMVFAGFCLIAAIFSNTFIDTLSKQVFQQLDEVKAKVKEVDQKASDASDKADTAAQTATDAKDTAHSTLDSLTDVDLPAAAPAADANERGIMESTTADAAIIDPSLSQPARQVLATLQASASIFNSETAIAQNSRIDPTIARAGLDELVQKNYVNAIPKGSNKVYSLAKKKAS